MKKRKTRFEQVPVEVAESALRQQFIQPNGAGCGSQPFGTVEPIQAGRRRLLRRRNFNLAMKRIK